MLVEEECLLAECDRNRALLHLGYENGSCVSHASNSCGDPNHTWRLTLGDAVSCRMACAALGATAEFERDEQQGGLFVACCSSLLSFCHCTSGDGVEMCLQLLHCDVWVEL